MTTYCVYCDESGHLQHGVQPNMVLGAIWCPINRVRPLSDALRKLKQAHGLSPKMEVKWTKVSPAKLEFYLSLVDFFFDQVDLRFRALLVPDKSRLDHRAFGQDHDTWYYKMYFGMLRPILMPEDRFRIYLDIKDTRSADKVRRLHEILCSSLHDFDQHIVERLQTVRSHELELMQLADLLIGAIQHAGRRPKKGGAKASIVRRVRARSGRELVESTRRTETKFNIFVWHAQEVGR